MFILIIIQSDCFNKMQPLKYFKNTVYVISNNKNYTIFIFLTDALS